MPAAAQSIAPADIGRTVRDIQSDALAEKITELYAYITAATHRFLQLVAEFDEKGYWQLGGVHSCAHWLNWSCGIGMNAAREKVRVARALNDLPKISKAFARGEISYSKVRAITRAANPENEDYLLMFARHGTANHVEKLIRGFRKVKRLQRAAREDTAPDNREVTSRWDDDDCLVITARLPGELGMMLLKAMDLAVDRQYEAERQTRDTDAAPTARVFPRKHRNALPATAPSSRSSRTSRANPCPWAARPAPFHPRSSAPCGQETAAAASRAARTQDSRTATT